MVKDRGQVKMQEPCGKHHLNCSHVTMYECHIVRKKLLQETSGFMVFINIIYLENSCMYKSHVQFGSFSTLYKMTDVEFSYGQSSS